jgi:hypothetical protein
MEREADTTRERYAATLREKDGLAQSLEARIAQLTASSTELQAIHKEELKRMQ